ncbi:MAG TPA: ABC transporter permease [Gemmatimonadaceae bacterium]|nr:ABC transporter permease [Gemmatimonadaceae bacterium]
MTTPAQSLAPDTPWGSVGTLLRDVMASRELLLAFVRRDLVLRYRQALLGVGWVVLSPLLNILVFTVIFTRVAPLDTGVPYPVFVYAGLWPWTCFATSVRGATVSLSANTALVTKVAFPRQVLPLAAVLVPLVDFVVAGALMAGLMAWYRIPVGVAVLALPLVLLVQVAFTVGVALVVSVANLYWRDTRHLVEAGLTIWMFATSVVYPVDRLGGTLGALLALNPMTPMVDAVRAVLLEGRLPAAASLGYSAAVALALLVVGGWWFQRSAPRFAECA